MEIMEVAVFPLSMLIVLGFSTLWYQSHPQSLVARGIAYLFGVMLILSAGMIANIYVISYVENIFAPNIVYFAMIASAVILFLKAINKITVKKLGLLYVLLAAVVGIAWIIMMMFK